MKYYFVLTETLQDLHIPEEPPQLEFKLSEFLDVTAENERVISFAWGEYQLLIEDKIKELAVFRCQQMLKHRAGLTNLQDESYKSDSEYFTTS